MWTGHPGVDDDGRPKVHGRRSIPASVVSATVDEEPPYAIHVLGRVDERTFKMSGTGHLDPVRRGARSGGVCPAGQADQPRGHYENVSADHLSRATSGPPILEEGARVSTPVKQISPFNDYAKAGLKGWQTYLGPTKGFTRWCSTWCPTATPTAIPWQCWNNKGQQRRSGGGYNTRQLPVLTLWKNTQTPGPGLCDRHRTRYQLCLQHQVPAPALGLVPKIQPGETKTFDLTLSPAAKCRRGEAGPGPGGEDPGGRATELREQPRSSCHKGRDAQQKLLSERNAVHFKRSRIGFTGKRVFDIFTALGPMAWGVFRSNMTPMQPRNSANLRGVWAGDNAPAITAIWFAMK